MLVYQNVSNIYQNTYYIYLLNYLDFDFDLMKNLSLLLLFNNFDFTKQQKITKKKKEIQKLPNLIEISQSSIQFSK